jgi:PAS domain S-box-containing protein
MAEPRKTILLVEDESLIALQEQMQLEAAGYHVIHSLTGEKAVEIVSEGPNSIDLILMDIDLGKGIDGTEAARRIHTITDIPVLFLSSHTEPEMVHKTEEVTNFGYVVKSSSFTVLDASIKMAFKLFSAIRELDTKNAEIEKMNKKLMTNEERFRLAMEATTDGIWDSEISKGVVYYSPAYWGMLGFTEGEIENPATEWKHLIHPEDRDMVINANKECRENKRSSFDIQFRMKTKEKTWKWIRSRGRAVSRDSCGNATRLIGIHEDISVIKETELALRESERHFRNIFEHAPIGIAYTSVEGKYIEANPEHARMLGYSSPEELKDITNLSSVGNTIYLNPEDRLTIIAQAQQNPDKWHISEQKLVKRNRDIIIGRLVFRVTAESPNTIVCFIEDITEQKHAIEIIEENEKRLDDIITASSDWVWEVDEKARFTYSSGKGSELLGYSTDEITGKPSFSLLDSEESDRMSAIFAETVKQKELIKNVENWRVKKNGERIFLQTNGVPIFDNEGNIKGYRGVCKDITEFKNTKNALRANEERLACILNDSSELICEIDSQGKYIFVNNSYKTILGFEPADLIGKYPKDYIHPEDYGKAISRHNTIRSSKEQSIDEWRFIDSNGNYHLFECHASAFFAKDDSPMIVVVSHDISERRKYELEVKELLNEKDILIREAHHRVKNSMSTIKSLISIEQMGLVDSTARSAFEKTQNRLDAFISLYEQLTISHDSNTLSIRCFLDSLIDKITKSYLDFDTITIQKEIDNFEVSASHGQALGIIANELLTNILKYAFAKEAQKTLYISAKRINNRISFSVQDNGKGLPQSIDFDHSTGLGLILIRELVKQLNGEISIERGNGTKFLLEFDE